MSGALTLDQLDVFMAVVEHGSFSAAARSLHRAQSAVSYGIARLEEELEVELFDRSGRTPTLTPAGKALVGDARAVRVRVDEMVARAKVFSRGVEPKLSLAVDAFFPAEALRAVLREFDARYPEVELVLHSSAMSETAALVLDGVCEVGVCGPFEALIGKSEIDLEKLAARRVHSIVMSPVVGASHELARMEGALGLETMREATQIVLTDRGPGRDSVDRGVLSERVWRVADLHTKLGLLTSGFGWGNMPLHMTREGLASGALRELRVEGWPERRRLALNVIHRRDTPPGPAARWLIAKLEELVASAPNGFRGDQGSSAGGGGGVSEPVPVVGSGEG